VGVVVGLAIGACISVPPFKGGDGGVDGSTCEPDVVMAPGTVSFTPDNGGGVVMSALYSVNFAGGNQLHFPSDITVGSADVMTAFSPSCGDEDLAGMAIYPAAAIRPNGAAPLAQNTLTPQAGWTGPAVVQLVAHWSANYSACSATPRGDSVFTLFPDGRVVRHDIMTSDQTVTWNNCGCIDDTNFFPSSYWAFDKDMFATLQLGTDAPVNAQMHMTQPINHPVACLQGSGAAVSVATAWKLVPGTTSRVRGLPETIAYVFDFVTMHANIPTTTGFSYSTTSALWLGGGCTEKLPYANEFAGSGAELRINGLVRRPALVDGIYGGVESFGGVGGETVVSMTAELTGTVRAFFAVWLRFPAATCDIAVSKVPDPGNVFFAKQKIDEDEWVVWFRDSLGPSDKITITAR